MFYLTLPSNGYEITYPENTPAKFKAKLVKEIFLPENDWKVALSIISFPSTLSSVIRDDVNYQLLVGVDFMCGMELNMDGVKDADGLYIGNKSYLLKGGRMKYEYGSKRRGLSASRDGVDFWNRMIALLNYRLHNRLPYKASDHTVVDKDLHLVFTNGQNLNGKMSVVHTAYHSSLHQKRPLYVYSDLVQTQFVGKSETDLLRDVEYDGSTDGNTVKNTYEPQNLQFIPIRKNFFDTLEIGISEIDGTQTQFLGCKNESTVVTLCFRRRGII